MNALSLKPSLHIGRAEHDRINPTCLNFTLERFEGQFLGSHWSRLLVVLEVINVRECAPTRVQEKR